MTTSAIPSSQPSSTNPRNWMLSTIYRPLISTFNKTYETHRYISSCPTISKLALTILAGTVTATVTYPLKITIIVITMECISLGVGKERYHTIFLKNPPYNNEIPSGLTTCIIVPLLEEVLFRGIIQPNTKALVNFIIAPCFNEATAKKIATITAIVFTSLLFGMVHLTNSSNLLVSLPQMISAAFSGIIYGLEKEFGGGLLETTVHHMANNTIAWGLLQIIKSGR
jgi:membrane protease YdiL (CAAX protease family)